MVYLGLDKHVLYSFEDATYMYISCAGLVDKPSANAYHDNRGLGHILNKSRLCTPCCIIVGCFWKVLPNLIVPYGDLGQVWYRIVSIPDLCLLYSFKLKCTQCETYI